MSSRENLIAQELRTKYGDVITSDTVTFSSIENDLIQYMEDQLRLAGIESVVIDGDPTYDLNILHIAMAIGYRCARADNRREMQSLTKRAAYNALADVSMYVKEQMQRV